MKNRNRLNLRMQTKVFLMIVMTYLLISGMPAGAQVRSDNVEGFLANEYLPGIDLWVNQTTSPSQGELGLNSLNQGWELQRYFILPQGAEGIEWDYLNPNVKLVFSLYSLEYSADNDQSIDLNQVGAENSETGLTSYTGQDVDGITRVDANEEVNKVDATNVPMTWEYFNTTAPTAASNNYTVPQNDITSGIKYTGGDSKSITEYADEVADQDGKTVYGVLNSTMVGFAYASQEDLQSIVWTYDDPSANSADQLELSALELSGIAKRYSIWMKAKKSEVANKWTGVKKKVTDINVMKNIKRISSKVPGVPSGAKFFSALGSPAAWMAKKLGTSVITETIQKRIGAIVGIVLFILAIVIFLNFRKGKRGKSLFSSPR